MSAPESADEPLSGRGFAIDVSTAVLYAVVVGALTVLWQGQSVAATLVLALALAVRRVSWQAMSVLAFLAAVLQLVLGEITIFGDLAYAVFFYTLGSSNRRLARRVGFSCAAVATATAAVFVGVENWSSSNLVLALESDRLQQAVSSAAAYGAMTAVVTFGGYFAGYIQWQQRSALQSRIEREREAAHRRRLSDLYDVEQERRRIATDMHDVVAHSWAVVAAQSDGARYALRDNPDQAERALETIGQTARSAITDLRTIVHRLRDPSVQPSTPSTAEEASLIERMRASGMDLDIVTQGDRTSSPLLALTAHRLLSESLTNVLKHGELSQPVVAEQDWRDGYRLTVTNAVPTTTRQPIGTGHGLTGMAERSAFLGGEFTAGPEADKWVVRVTIPGGEA